jgi:hypothetical protein
MAIRLKTKGVEKFSLRAKELMEDSLEARGEFALAVAYLPRETAQKIATLNNLTLDYKTVMWKSRPEEYYLFRIDYQQQLWQGLREKRKWTFIRNLTLASILAFLLGLLSQIFFYGGGK